MFACSFLKVFKRAPPPSKLIPAALSQFRCLAEEPLISKLRNSVQVVRSDKKNQEALSEDGDCVEVAKASFHLLSQASSRVEDSDYTDNSSGETVSQVCAVGSEHQRRQQKHFNDENQRKQHFQTLWTILNNVFFLLLFFVRCG